MPYSSLKMVGRRLPHVGAGFLLDNSRAGRCQALPCAKAAKSAGSGFVAFSIAESNEVEYRIKNRPAWDAAILAAGKVGHPLYKADEWKIDGPF